MDLALLLTVDKTFFVWIYLPETLDYFFVTENFWENLQI